METGPDGASPSSEEEMTKAEYRPGLFQSQAFFLATPTH